jgi:predicted alpha/beta superfamily hydrolase
MCAQGESSTRYPAVSIRSTEVRSLRSQMVEGMEYRICVALPEGYDASSECYPALYLLDAWQTFGTVVESYRLHCDLGLVPKLVLFGISHTGKTWQDHFYYRSRDFTPTELSTDEVTARHGAFFASITPVSGGARRFLQFMQDELFPFAEREYRLIPSDRGLFGYSYGGLFVMYALFNAPQLFQRYFIGSAASWWDDYAVFGDEARYAQGHTALPARVYASTGGAEGDLQVQAWKRLRDILRCRNYSGLQLTTVMFDGEDHFTCSALAHVHAMRALYQE